MDKGGPVDIVDAPCARSRVYVSRQKIRKIWFAISQANCYVRWIATTLRLWLEDVVSCIGRPLLWPSGNAPRVMTYTFLHSFIPLCHASMQSL